MSPHTEELRRRPPAPHQLTLAGGGASFLSFSGGNHSGPLPIVRSPRDLSLSAVASAFPTAPLLLLAASAAAANPDSTSSAASFTGFPGANRSKGAKGPEEWRPPDEGYWCQYATDWTEVKMEWGLTMTQRETETVIEMLDTCEELIEVEAERAGGIAGTGTSGRATEGEATATPILGPEPTPQENISVYGSCEEAVEAGESRVQGGVGGGRGFPKEMVPSARDGDGDGIVCER